MRSMNNLWEQVLAVMLLMSNLLAVAQEILLLMINQ